MRKKAAPVGAHCGLFRRVDRQEQQLRKTPSSPAGHIQDGPSRVRGFVRHQPDDHICELVRAAEARRRDQRDRPGFIPASVAETRRDRCVSLYVCVQPFAALSRVSLSMPQRRMRMVAVNE
jgi:hypothetical protein